MLREEAESGAEFTCSMFYMRLYADGFKQLNSMQLLKSISTKKKGN